MDQKLINHVVFVVDESGSMRGRKDDVIRVFNRQLLDLATLARRTGQETRVTLYTFSYREDIRCIVYDTDIERVKSILANYDPHGQTALIDATLRAVRELERTPQLYGDHAFLVYVLTDGQENHSGADESELQQVLNSLGENWTVAVLVPDNTCRAYAQRYGFPRGNISIWDSTSTEGVEEMGRTISHATEQYYVGRTTGVRGTKGLFTLDVDLTQKKVGRKLDELIRGEYDVFNVTQTATIRDFVEAKTRRTYRIGSAYYELMKPETIQIQKELVLYNTITGKYYSGRQARTLLNLPDYTVKVSPGNFKQFKIFVQSTSVNRRLLKGTQLIVVK